MKLASRLTKSIAFVFTLPFPGSPLHKLKKYVHPAILTWIRNTLGAIRINKSVTRLLGPQYQPKNSLIEIDITYRCLRACTFCNRFIDIAPSSLEMTPQQIQRFVQESIQQKRH